MATVVITPATPAFDVQTADLGAFGGTTNGSGLGANGIVATATADGWTITPPTGRSLAEGTLVLLLTADASGDTFTVLPGNRLPSDPLTTVVGVKPPSMRGGLAPVTYVLAAQDTVMVFPDVSKCITAAGTIIITSTDIGSSIAAAIAPRGA